MDREIKPIPHDFRSTNEMMKRAFAEPRSWRWRLRNWLGMWR